jgi:hypothetical protein
MAEGIGLSAVFRERLGKLYAALLDLHNHANIRPSLSMSVMEFDHLDPFLEKDPSSNFITPEADTAKVAKSSPISLRNTADQPLKVSVPCHDYSRKPISHDCHNGIRASRSENVPNESHIVAAINKHLRHRKRDIFVNEQQHFPTICRSWGPLSYALSGFMLDGGRYVCQSETRVFLNDLLSRVPGLVEIPNRRSGNTRPGHDPGVVNHITISIYLPQLFCTPFK